MPKNIYLQHLHSQTLGQKIKIQKVPADVIYSNSKTKDHQVALNCIQTLDSNNFAKIFHGDLALETLRKLAKLYEESEGNYRFQPYVDRNGKETLLTDDIHLFGGVEVIMRTLFHPTVDVKKPSKHVSNDMQLKIQCLCLDILNNLSAASQRIAKFVGQYEFLFKYLFNTMEHDITFVAASTLLEELLAANRKIIDLSSIKNLHTLVSNLTDEHFPGFCRILSSTVADIDLTEERSTLIAQDKEDKSRFKERALVEQNQGVLLGFPEFLLKMVKLASRPVPRRVNNYYVLNSNPAPQYLFPSIEEVHEQLASISQSINNSSNGATGSSSNSGASNIFSSSFASSSSSSQRSNSNVSSPSTSLQISPSSSSTSQQDRAAQARETIRPMINFQVSLMQEIMHKVEVLYVLTLFLCGKSKKEVQCKLGELKFIPVLGELFDKLSWNTDSDERFPRFNHPDSEESDYSPENALKIQFLRFIHSFCDHNEKRYLLLSAREIQEMKDLCSKCATPKPTSLDKSKSKYRCQGTKGIMSKIIETLTKTNPNNALRFWLSRAIEGFLRGAVSAPDQHFLMNRGLIKHLVEHIVNDDTKSKEIIQSSFDLLGELMKFNSAGFQNFNDAVENEQQFEKFLSVMTSNVVDSNMFIRSAVLSHEKFVSDGTNLKCRLGNTIKKWEHKIYLMYKLVTAISVDSLTQENVSCLNTTLIFLMFAYNHGQLDKYLQAFLTEEQAQKHPGLILSNLYELLRFWRNHYLSRKKDCEQLEQSSSISFDQWRLVVDVMLNEDKNKRTSILYYLTPHHRSSMRFCAVDFPCRDV
eukprot:TCONS_00070896-protein